MISFDLSSFLPYRLAVLSERISKCLSLEYARSHGISVAEWRVLVHLAHGREVSVRDIHNCVNLEKPRVSRAVTGLEKAGLARKGTSKADSRLVAISLTEQGRAVLGEILPSALEFEAKLLDALSAQELERFYEIAEKLHAVLDNDPTAPRRSVMDRSATRSA
ncbi:winged helix-turn-helix transcriptional regulator [Rhodobacteraceae bacterium F11138]|nr:winged helix-turn-helix transcriptional regulator [Rhodobacteraceae bacterium F11138]